MPESEPDSGNPTVRDDNGGSERRDLWRNCEPTRHTERVEMVTLRLSMRALRFYPNGAADKTVIQLVRVQPCQLPDSDTERCHIPGQATTRAMRGVYGLAAQHQVLRWVQPGGQASAGA